MPHNPSRTWRALFVGGGLLYFVGGFNHPRGVMSDMLVDPAWIPAHSAVLVGLILMTIGLISFRRSTRTSARMDTWLFYTIVLSVLEVFEMGLHTMAFVDAPALASGYLMDGMSTPVLTLHIWLGTLFHTPFSIALIVLIWIGQREQALGSPWISWLGIIGAAAHGSVMWLVVVLQMGAAGILFPIGALAMSLWFVLAGAWPTRQTAMPNGRSVASVAAAR